MAYTRKTRDVYELHADYGYGDGWEYVTTEHSRERIRARQREYRENCPQYATRIIIKRERIEENATA